MNQKATLLLLLLLQFSLVSKGQELTLAWSNSMPDSTHIIAQTVHNDSTLILLTKHEKIVDYYNLDDSLGKTTTSNGYGIISYDIHGEYYWSKFYEDTLGNLSFTDIDVDHKGYVYIYGSFTDSLDLDPNQDTVSIKTSNDNEDLVLVVLDEVGNYKSHLQLGGDGVENADKLTVDGNLLLLSGGFDREIQSGFDFNPSSTENDSLEASNASGDNFLLQLDTVFNYQWAYQFSRSSGDSLFTINDLKLDRNRRVYVCGSTNESFNGFANDSDTVGYLMRLDGNGELVWAIQPSLYPDTVIISQQSSDWITVDDVGDIYLSSSYQLDSVLNDSLITNFTSNLAVSKINAKDGTGVWLNLIEGNFDQYNASIFFNINDDLYVFQDSRVHTLIDSTGIRTGSQTVSLRGHSSIDQTPILGDYFASGFTNGEYFVARFYPDDVTTWSNERWTRGKPYWNIPAILEDDYSTSINGEFVTSNLLINRNAQLDIRAGDFIEVLDSIENKGNITMHQSGALFHEHYTGSGSFTVNFSLLSKTGYSFFSSPVQNESSTVLGTAFLYNESLGSPNKGDNWQVPNGDLFVGKGYAVYQTEQAFNVGGIPNSGNFRVSVTNTNSDGYNLIGNPYPSPISGTSFLNENDNISALYFWDDDETDGQDYSSSDYITWNLTGSTGGNGENLNGSIPMGQAFFVNVATTDEVIFNHSMRQSFQDAYLRKGNIQNRLWLTLEGVQLKKELLLATMDWASENFDTGWDALAFNNGSNNTTFTTLDKDRNHLAIQALPLQDEYTIPLLIENFEGKGLLKIEKIEGFKDFDIEIIDHQEGVNQSIQKDGYQFDASKDDGERFSLFITPKNSNVLSLEETLASLVKIKTLPNGFNVMTPFDTHLIGYNTLGEVMLNTHLKKGEVFIPTEKSEILILRFNSNKGSFTKKVIR
ncbi:hypothetical protein [Flammeovirga aprica]|uniref:T9SS type A sorting domain-containing protein n=1 Tax=Flammeovirga aprica JL-4 TaxID=694437 RepID=A0A7X9P2B5_9BACT|nr:hypothetical protein [Flammeovirga aprica]NME68273.1 hypothetical protein [Flammeovirga aprica JL-4]